MQTVNLYSFLSEVETRKRAIGFDESPEAVERLRNRGGNRSPNKRALLGRAESRARAAGLEPIISYR